MKIFGDPGCIRGGLFKFIDDHLNPNAALSKSCELVVVHAKINEVGAFMLRELLESSERSRTHRLGIPKTKLMFLLSLEEGMEISPQLKSRSHLIL